MSKYKTEELERFSTAFKALANPHRLEIFNILSRCCEPGSSCTTDEALRCCVGDLGPRLDIAPSTLSHHLKEMNRAGLVDMNRIGKQIYCSLNTSMLKEIRMLFKFYEQNAKSAARSANQENLI